MAAAKKPTAALPASPADLVASHGTHDISPATAIMAAMLAHEVKNPLSGIRGAAQLLGQNANDADKKLTDLICREVDRINALINKIEFFSNAPVECGEAVNIHEVLQYVRELAINGFAANVTIDSRYDPSLPDVRGDRELLIQLFMNLIKNAAEALEGHEAPRITLKTGYQINHKFRIGSRDEVVALPVAITIEDNGGGIPESLQASLFDPFVTSKSQGKGLGLAICAKIVGDHGGTIAVDTSLAGHTRFHILLPIYRA